MVSSDGQPVRHEAVVGQASQHLTQNMACGVWGLVCNMSMRQVGCQPVRSCHVIVQDDWCEIV